MKVIGIDRRKIGSWEENVDDSKPSVDHILLNTDGQLESRDGSAGGMFLFIFGYRLPVGLIELFIFLIRSVNRRSVYGDCRTPAAYNPREFISIEETIIRVGLHSERLSLCFCPVPISLQRARDDITTP